LELDEEQEIVVGLNKSTSCISGPGSGKTRILTEKARRLLQAGKDIICICFTRTAAREMASRVENLPATTIHSYCNQAVGWNEDWGYTGLLYRYLLTKDKRRFDWVLLDEAQDVNQMELDVVLSMVGDKFFAVGDPYQSIYGFQGALGMDAFLKLGTLGCETIEVHNNYRSCPEVIRTLNRIYNRKLVSKGVKETGLTAVLCRTNDDVSYVSSELKKLGVPHRLRVSVDRAIGDRRENDILGESNLRVSTIHVSKGQEFDNVRLFGWKPERLEDEEKRVWYVANSRASKTFRVVDSIEEILSGS
jgi:superfamily I DNA/RNA helicase